MKANASFQPTARTQPQRAGEPTTERRPQGAPGPQTGHDRPSSIANPPRGSAPERALEHADIGLLGPKNY